jgi:RNA polymerase sigma factor (sigma-70 family)
MRGASLQRVTQKLRQIAGRGSSTALTDRRLLDRFLVRADEAAFAELVHRHGPMVLGVCRRVLHHHQDAEDAFQAAFLVLARKAGAVRDAESVGGWLFQVAFRLALRAAGRDRHKEPLTAMNEPTSAASAPDGQEMQQLIDEALDRLPEHYRSAVVLCCLEGRTQSEAARQLGTTSEAINSRIKRARQLLRAHLKRRGVAVATVALSTALAAQRASAAAFPLGLLGRTSQAAMEFAADPTQAPAASPAAVALAQGALRTMWITPCKLLSGLGLILGVVLAAIWLPAVVTGTSEAPVPISASAPQTKTEPAQPPGGKGDKPGKMHVIILWMSGGPSQLDTWDPKPGNANGGPFKAINTNVKEIQISEHLPKLAKLADNLAIIRSMSHADGDHGRATYLMQTGYEWDGQTKYPELGAILGKELGDDKTAIPPFVLVGSKILFTDLGSGYLGPRYSPIHVKPAKEGFTDPDKAPDMSVPPLETFQNIDKDKAEAMRKLVVKAVDRSEEKKELVEAYGPSQFGQSCLTARRLVELGVPVVEVTMGGWDTHANGFDAVEKLSKKLDAGFATLIKDLKDRKLLDSTLIVWMGEFGRTPRINPQDGRDHWMKGFSVVLAGAKIKGGQVIGSTNDDGTQVTNQPISVAAHHATICTAVGVDHNKQYQSNTGKPIRIVPSGFKAIEGAIK